jgi:heterodisulfide reductase subunit C2
MNALHLAGHEPGWAHELARQTGIHVSSCYQCLRCTNACPVSTFMDIKPHQVVRNVILGQREALLACSSIWVCLSCEMCSTYCPNEIDVAALMSRLKNMVMELRRKPAEVPIATFHKIFLDVLGKHGRINELQLMHRYHWHMLRQGFQPRPQEIWRDLKLTLELVKRGRLKLLPERAEAVMAIRELTRHGEGTAP